MNGVIYCRVSSKEQIQGTSLESQEVACREYAKQQSISVLRTFIERGESAKFADRTQLLELIDFCKQNKGQVQRLLVWKLDRFSRNVGDHFSVKAALGKYGVRILSVTEPIDTNPEGKLMETILAGFAQFDNDIRAMRTVQGMRRKIQEGIFPFKPPLGYESANDQGEKKIEPDRPKQPTFGLLQKVWKEFATGAYTKAEIRRLMAKRGIVDREGKPLAPSSIDGLFSNVYYRGTLIDPWSGEEYEGRHIPMVSRAEFARVQEIIGKRNRSLPHHKNRPEFPLRGLVRCPGCSHYLTGSFSRGRGGRYGYYRCNNKGCEHSGTSVPVNAVHDEFAGFLSEIAPKPLLIEKVGELILQHADERRAELSTKRERLRVLQTKLRTETQELIRMRAQGLITDQEFLVQKSMLSKRGNALEAGHWPADAVNPAILRNRVHEITKPLSDLRETWTALEPSRQQRFQRLLLPVGFVVGRIGTADLGLLFSAFGAFRSRNAGEVACTVKTWNQILQEITDFADLLRPHREADEDLIGAVRRDDGE
jgi:DNA invertase Pin-like site-specific DNA recombinase